MKSVVFNDNCLSVREIEKKVLKARALIVNDEGEILLSEYAEIYLLPGGKIESNEDIFVGLQREIKEETGIDIDIRIEPFLCITQFLKNYPSRNNTVVNRLVTIFYYIIYSNEIVNPNRMKLMTDEKQNNFHTFRIKPEEALILIEDNKSSNHRNKYFMRELKKVINEYLLVKEDNLCKILKN